MVTTQHRAPGVRWQDVGPAPAPGFLTGVPAFLGYAREPEPPVPADPADPAVPPATAGPVPLTLWPQLATSFGEPPERGYLAPAVRGFFENQGLLCYVVALDPALAPDDALRQGLDRLQSRDDVDLVCAPDIVRAPPAGPVHADLDVGEVTRLQRILLDHCAARGDRFAVLDAVPDGVGAQRAALDGDHGALYHPWVWAPGSAGPLAWVPPCGHVAGTYSRTDREVGVHKAPANVPLDGVLDVSRHLREPEVARLYDQGVNCLRALPGRGVRVWGARTLATDPGLRPVNVRRVLLTLGRWLERFMESLVHEPHDVRLRVRIVRDLSGHLDALHRRGALVGRTPEEAYYVRCDGETNPPDMVRQGFVVTHVGVAPVRPAEFVEVRVIQGASGVSITTA